MKRFLCRIAVLLAVLGCCTACFTTMAALTAAVVLSNITPGERVNLSGRTVEALAPQGQAALMRTEGGDVVCIVYQFKDFQSIGIIVLQGFQRARLKMFVGRIVIPAFFSFTPGQGIKAAIKKN